MTKFFEFPAIFVIFLFVKRSSQAILTQPNPVDSAESIVSDPYIDYEKACPEGLAVDGFQYQTISGPILIGATTVGANGTDEAKKTRDYDDVVLKATCARPVDDKALTAALASNNLNDTSITCRYAESFNIRSPVNESDSTRMCKPGEYIGGAQSVFWNSQRLIKLKCCQSAATFHDSSYGCYNVRLDAINDSVHTTVPRGDGCPVDVLTGVGISNRTGLVGRYCSLSVVGSNLSSTGCQQQRQLSITQLQAVPTTPAPQLTPAEIRQRLPSFSPGQRTTPGQSFRVECDNQRAISGITAEPFVFASTGSSELAYTFTCAPVTDGNQTAVRRRYTGFSSSVYSEIDCYRNDEALCGVYSQIDSKTRLRQFSFACCEYSNAILSKSNSEFQAFLVNGTSDKPKAVKKGQVIQRLVVQEGKSGTVFIKTSFSTYNHTEKPIFNETAELPRRQTAGASQYHFDAFFMIISIFLVIFVE